MQLVEICGRIEERHVQGGGFLVNKAVNVIGNELGLSGTNPDRKRAGGFSDQKNDRDGDREPDGQANRFGGALAFRCGDECVDEFAGQKDGGHRQEALQDQENGPDQGPAAC